MKTARVLTATAIAAMTMSAALPAMANDEPAATVGVTYDAAESTTTIAIQMIVESDGLDLNDLTELVNEIDEVRGPQSAQETSGRFQVFASASEYRSAPIWGSSTNNGRTWVMYSTLEHVQCTLVIINCQVTDRYKATVTIDPGNSASRIGIGSFYFPNSGRISPPTYTVEAWRNATYTNGSRTLTAFAQARVEGSLTHALPQRGNNFGYYVTGYYDSNGTRRSLSPGRTPDGVCTGATTPVCTW